MDAIRVSVSLVYLASAIAGEIFVINRFRLLHSLLPLQSPGGSTLSWSVGRDLKCLLFMKMFVIMRLF